MSYTQYDMNNSKRSFNYSLFESYLVSENDYSDINLSTLSRGQTTIEANKIILNQINQHYGSDLQIPDVLLGFSDYTGEQMKQIALDEGFLNEKDIELIVQFVFDSNDLGYETGLNNFEDSVLDNLNLSEDEFTKYNTYANFFEVIKYENPQIFERLNSGNWLTCIVAMIVWVASLIGFVLGCITIFLCALAAFAFGAATVEVVLECVPDTP